MMRPARADAAGKSGTAVILSSAEIDLGPKGWGEIEFTVAVGYKIDVTYDLRAIKSVDWNVDEDGRNRSVSQGPRAEIEKAVRRYIDKNQRRYFEELMEKIG